MKPLYVVSYRLFSFLDCREEFIHGHFGIILIESGEEPSFHVKLTYDGTIRKVSKLVKSYHLEGAREQPGQNNIIIYYITGSKVIDMPIW